MLNLLQQIRPTTVTIFASDPFNQSKALAFVLARVSGIVPGIENLTRKDDSMVTMHTTKSMQATMTFKPARNPIERYSVDNMIEEPETLLVQSTLSANPMGFNGLLPVSGVAGTILRADLTALATLRSLAKKREPLIVVTPVRTYVDMALVGIAETHLGPNKVDVQLSFETIKITSPILKPSVFATADVGTYEVENLGSWFPKAI